LSLGFGRIGQCDGCKHVGDVAVCGACERDQQILQRRDLHGAPLGALTCGQCQRDVRLLARKDRYKKGLPDGLEEKTSGCAKEAGMTPVSEAIQSWLRE
jgi:hypothetical protein